MGRIRTIKPEFFMHSGLFELEEETGLPIRLAFAGLWTCCDREGRFKWRPRELKAVTLPYDNCDFSRVLDALATRGYVVKYASPSIPEEYFGFIPKWKKHQFINNKEPHSDIPKPDQNQSLDASVTRDEHEDDATGSRGVKEGKGREGKGMGGDASVTRPAHSLGESMMAAVWLFEELGLASSFKDRELLSQVISLESRITEDCEQTAKFLLASAKQAQARGEVVNAFWFKDRKFDPAIQAKGNGHGRPTSQSKQAATIAATNAVIARIRGLDGAGTGQDRGADGGADQRGENGSHRTGTAGH